MPALVRNTHRILAADYFQYNATQSPLYVFIGGTTPWADENLPPSIKDSVEDNIFAYDEIIGGKKVQSVDMISVLPRYDWKTNTVFDQYDHRVNLIDEKNPETNDYYKFYVITDEFDVYKCLSNNYRSPSTVKPSGRSISSFETPDGYVWKFMYNVRSYDAFKFMTPNWIPCYSIAYNDGSTQWLVQSSSTKGTIDNIDITDAGISYSQTTPPTVTITGDGTGATAVADVNNDGTLNDIIVTNTGEGYTEATVTITDSGSGVGATAIAFISPINGHGNDAREELGSIYKMIRMVFDGDEGGILPTDNVTYRKVGMFQSPLDSNISGNGLIIAGNEELFQIGDTVTGATSGATATVSSIDKVNKKLYVKDVVGSFSQGELISSNNVNQTEVLLIELLDNIPLTKSVFSNSDVVPNTGNIIYFSTRELISRGLNQSEEVRLILSF